MASPPISIARQSDGRYHVQDANGTVLGKHKTPWSAARQMHEYYGDQGQAESGTGVGTEHPPVPRPTIPRPKQSTAPNEQPKRIPRP